MRIEIYEADHRANTSEIDSSARPSVMDQVLNVSPCRTSTALEYRHQRGVTVELKTCQGQGIGITAVGFSCGELSDSAKQ